jgi:NodT family efflux transporter outer membrane factor (OMF) lipoprotein
MHFKSPRPGLPPEGEGNLRSLWVGIILLALPLILTSCAVGPDYVRPKVLVPSHFKEAHGKKVVGKKSHQQAGKRDIVWKDAQPNDSFHRGAWWEIFHDAKLNELEYRLNRSNQSIKQAYYNFRQACAVVDEARAAFFPTLMASLGFTRQKQSSNVLNTSVTPIATATAGGGSAVQDNFSWLLNASWEPDIWGSVRRNVEANDAAAQASKALLAATRLSSQASLAQFYFELRGLDADQRLLDATVKKYVEILRYAQHRYKRGVDSNADIIQAKSQLATAQAASVNNGILRAQYEHAIAVLIGVPPADLSLRAYPLNVLPPPIPLSLPSTLLERRPDIAQAERLMAQANAQIGVAVATYFPALTLTGSANTVTKTLFSFPAVSWAMGAQLADTILDGGLRAATIKAAQEGYLANVAAYRQTVLAAFQDVEDNLASFVILQKQAIYQNRAAALARDALQLTLNQYRAGTADYSAVYIAQISAFTAEKAASDVTYLRMTAAVGLVKALGGGWDAKLVCIPMENIYPSNDCL